MNNLSQKINQLFERDRYPQARKLLEKELAKPGNEGSHWLLTRLATTYYEERNYRKALKLEEQALALAPDCPLVLWDYAGSLDALGRSAEAIEVYMALIQRGPERVGKEECGEGVKWAISLLTDCFYRISVCLKDLQRSKEAMQFLIWYAGLVSAGAQSIYTEDQSGILKHVLKVLEAYPGEKRPRSPRQRIKEFSKEAAQLLHAA